MATRTAVVDRTPAGYRNAIQVTWSGLTFATTDDGTPIADFNFSDRSVQVTGVLGTGGSVRIEGSNDGVTYYVLTDPQGNALDIASLKLEAITELTKFIRPRVTAGDGDTALAVHLFAVRR